ncbi:MAG: hypothetical protein NTX50_23145, partial [Candidatus Sumerlaeota bacterium]|nr:hypothetical protein [Candidatus Sumerlaeota bacterium]
QAAKMMDELKKNLQNNSVSDQEKAAIQKELKMLAGQLGPETPAGKALAKACENMSAGQFNSALANLEEGGAALLDMEAMLQELKALDSLQYDMDARKLALCGKACLCEGCKNGKPCLGGNCPGCQGVGEWTAGDSRNQGNGMGRAGIGQGGIARSAPNNVAFQQKRIQGNIAPGEIIAKMKVPGTQMPGEASVSYEQMREMAKQQAEDTIQNDVMPLEHRALIRDYFAAIKESGTEQKK